MCVPGVKRPCFVRTAVDRVVEEVGADAAVVQQRIPFAGRAVAHDRFAFLRARRSRKSQQLAFRRANAFFEIAYRLRESCSPRRKLVFA